MNSPQLVDFFSRKTVVWTGLIAILILGGLQRVVTSSDSVFVDGETRLLGADSYFHLRHAHFFACNFPVIPRHDLGAHYPSGYPDDATGLFALSIGAISGLVSAGSPEIETVATVAAWFPVVLGILSILVVFLIGSALAGPGLGLLSALLYLVFPDTALNYSLLGFADHHIAEVLLVGLCIYAWIRGIQKYGLDPDRKKWRPAFALGVPFILFHFTWIGTPLYSILFAQIIVLYSCFVVARGGALDAFSQGSFSVFSPFVLVFALVWGLWPELIIQNVWYRLPILLSGMVLAGGPSLVNLSVRYLRRRGTGDRAIAVVLVFAFSLIAAVFFTATSVGSTGLSILLGQRTDAVREQVAMSFLQMTKQLGSTGFLALLGLPLVLYRVWSEKERDEQIIVILMGTIMMFVWWRTRDFGYVTPLSTALAAGLCLTTLFGMITRFFDRRRIQIAERDRKKAGREKGKSGRPDVTNESTRGREIASPILIGSILVVVFAFPIWPAKFTQPWLTNTQIKTLAVYSNGWFDAMDWLRDSTPNPVANHHGDGSRSSEPLVNQESAYGVFSSWDFGNVVAAIGGRPPVYSRYPQPREGQFLMATSAQEAETLLCPECTEDQQVRYVIVDARTAGDFFATKSRYSGHPVPLIWEEVLGVDQSGKEVQRATFGAAFDSSMTARLYLDDGRNLQHYRLVYEPPDQAFVAYRSESARTPQGLRTSVTRVAKILDDIHGPALRKAARLPFVQAGPSSYVYDGHIQSSLKIFEKVLGAKLAGYLPSSGSVHASLPLSVATTARTFSYQSTVTADSSGYFEMILPYATQTADSAVVQVTGEYSFRFEGRSDVTQDISWTMAVTEEDILDGHEYEAIVRGDAVDVTRRPDPLK